MGKYFGTDGIRSKSIDFTKDFLTLIVDSLITEIKKTNKKPTILLGGDTRLSTKDILENLIELLNERGVDTINIGVIPTPAISFLTGVYSCDCSIDITASHNPYTDNGIKILNSNGEKLDEDFIAKLEENLDNRVNCSITKIKGSNKNLAEEAIDKYIEHLINDALKILGSDTLNLNSVKIGIDCANGATSTIVEQLFSRLSENFTIINQDFNYGTKINNNCGSTHLEELKKLVIKNKLDFGIAFDGDGDRCLMVDNTGQEIDGDFIIAIIASYFKTIGLLLNNKIASTVMANQGLIAWCKNEGIENVITAVGDANVYDAMKKENIIIGGEQSGHIILPNQKTGDGLLTALLVSKIVADSKKSLKEVASIMTKYPQNLTNIKIDNDDRLVFTNSKVIDDKIKETQKELQKEDGRILVRLSGTEPLIRISMWGKNQENIDNKCKELEQEIKLQLNLAKYETRSLFDIDKTIAKNLFEQFSYPWEVLDSIGDFIKKIGPTLDTNLYEKRENDVYIAKNSTIHPTTIIDGPAIICENAKTNPYSWIRANVIVGNNSVVGHCSEIKNSILLEGAHIGHRNYVGDSIIGCNVNMGNGSCTANLKLNAGDIVSINVFGDCFIKTRRKFGAMIGDNSSLGCLANINPGTIIGKNVYIYGSSFVRENIPANCIYKHRPNSVIVEKI